MKRNGPLLGGCGDQYLFTIDPQTIHTILIIEKTEKKGRKEREGDQ
jgi:hypothetical protein